MRGIMFLIFAFVFFLAGNAAAQNFADVEIDEQFQPLLTGNRLLMEVTGAKVIRCGDGKTAVIGVASTFLKDASAQERLRAERVCRIKALANVVAEKEGVQVAHLEKLEERTRIVIDNKEETADSVSELLQITQTKVEGIAKDMPVIGTWKSKDGDVFYLAIGAMVSDPK
jgi:hypothetical protein